MKILHIITGLGDGGAEAVLYRLCTHDTTQRHLVISLTTSGKYGPLLEAKGISVISIGMQRGNVTPSGFWRLWRLWRLWRQIRRVRPDVVQTWMYHADLLGGIAAKLAGVRRIVWGIHHTTLVAGESSRSAIMAMQLCARLSRVIPNQILCCAEESLRVHAEKGYDRDRMRVVPNGYDVSIFRPDQILRFQFRKELGL